MIALPSVVRGKAALSRVDVGITASAVHLVVDRLARTALTSSACNMLGAHLAIDNAKGATSPGRSRHVLHREATATGAHICVPTSAVGVVYFGSTCSRQDVHYGILALNTSKYFCNLF